MKRIRINVDVGEGFAHDRDLLSIATCANICCGVHAGSAELTKNTIDLANLKGVEIGAHPGAPDRMNMGRGHLDLEDEAASGMLAESLKRQVDDFRGIFEPAYMKLHGSLYTQSASQECGPLIVRFIQSVGLPLLGLPGTRHESLAHLAGVPLIREGFADRVYDENGLLRSRAFGDALLLDLHAIEEQVLRLAETVDSICVHGDTPGGVEIALHVREVLERDGYDVY